MSTPATEPAAERPLLRIVRGTPDDEELAALTAVVASVAAAGDRTAPAGGSGSASTSRWADRAALVRRPLTFGPGAWRASGFPH
jgi:hypothetical protein